MRCLFLIFAMIGTIPALASPYFPLTPGAIWEFADDDPAMTMTMTMSGPESWHGATCSPRFETIDDQIVGISYWSVDSSGRTLLHGLRYIEGAEWYFFPPIVYLDPLLACGESTTHTTDVFEVHDVGDQFYGTLSVQVTCLNRDPLSTPLGTVPGIAVNTAWPDSPDGAPWRYGHDGVLSYGFGVGPSRITGQLSPEDLILVAVHNLQTTTVPDATGRSLVAAPNPFNPQTNIRFETVVAGPVRLEILDVAGHRVAVLRDEVLGAGPHSIPWRPRAVPSGVYIARLTTPHRVTTTRLTLLE